MILKVVKLVINPYEFYLKDSFSNFHNILYQSSVALTIFPAEENSKNAPDSIVIINTYLFN